MPLAPYLGFPTHSAAVALAPPVAADDQGLVARPGVVVERGQTVAAEGLHRGRLAGFGEGWEGV